MNSGEESGSRLVNRGIIPWTVAISRHLASGGQKNPTHQACRMADLAIASSVPVILVLTARVAFGDLLLRDVGLAPLAIDQSPGLAGWVAVL
ncbi:MAG: hypothetical protein RLY70_562, partial [Planctomycetota bacterium]